MSKVYVAERLFVNVSRSVRTSCRQTYAYAEFGTSVCYWRYLVSPGVSLLDHIRTSRLCGTLEYLVEKYELDIAGFTCRASSANSCQVPTYRNQ